MKKIKAGIVGGAGYAGGELLRLLIHHPLVDVEFVQSKSHAGVPVHDVHTDLLGDTDIHFSAEHEKNVDVVFLCLAHGESSKRIHEFDASVRVIDFGQDFRINKHETRNFTYGLPELHREKISKSSNIANPGCFATAIQLALLPLAKQKLLQSDITISCTTGSTGAGQSLTESSHFSWRQNNLSVYKAFTHQHLEEIGQSLQSLQSGFDKKLVMIPQRGAFTRGILACINMKTSLPLKELKGIFQTYYLDHPFVHLSEKNIDLKQVVNTNKCLLYLEKYQDELLIVSVIDNLVKGASGQAVQNMNLLFGLNETAGLQLKATVF